MCVIIFVVCLVLQSTPIWAVNKQLRSYSGRAESHPCHTRVVQVLWCIQGTFTTSRTCTIRHMNHFSLIRMFLRLREANIIILITFQLNVQPSWEVFFLSCKIFCLLYTEIFQIFLLPLTALSWPVSKLHRKIQAKICLFIVGLHNQC